MTISADTQQNLFFALYFLVLHNAEAIGYTGALILSTLWGLVKPSRGRILLMLGFAFLLLGFEYGKHIQESLYEQTKQSLITERYSSRAERAISISINKVAPYGLKASGVGCVALGISLELLALKKKGYNADRRQ